MNLPKLIFLFTLLLSSKLYAADQNLYLSAGGKLTVFIINNSSGELSPLQEIDLPGAGPMTASPDRQFLYVTASLSNPAGGKKQGAAIVTFKVESDGKLKKLASGSVNLRPGYLKTDAKGNYLAGNHYGPGKITLWKLENHIYQGQTVQEVELEQKAHSSVFSPNNRYLLVPATGPNKVFQLSFDPSTGKAKPNDPAFAPGPQGDKEARQPRHLIFHPGKKMVYTTNERELPGVGVWSWNPDKGSLKSIQNIPTQPDGFKGNITTADLHMTPDQKFLYISNRDVTDRKATTGEDSIVGFSVNQDNGQLTKLGHFPCEHVPRSFVIGKNGRFLFVAGQGDSRLGTYRIDSSTGSLTKIEQQETGKNPIWVHCMNPPAP